MMGQASAAVVLWWRCRLARLLQELGRLGTGAKVSRDFIGNPCHDLRVVSNTFVPHRTQPWVPPLNDSRFFGYQPIEYSRLATPLCVCSRVCLAVRRLRNTEELYRSLETHSHTIFSNTTATESDTSR